MHNFQQVGTYYRKKDWRNTGGVHNPKFEEALDIPDDILFMFFDKHTPKQFFFFSVLFSFSHQILEGLVDNDID